MVGSKAAIPRKKYERKFLKACIAAHQNPWQISQIFIKNHDNVILIQQFLMIFISDIMKQKTGYVNKKLTLGVYCSVSTG